MDTPLGPRRHVATTLERIEAGLRATAAFGRDVTHVRCFQVAIAPGGAAGLAVAVPEHADTGCVDPDGLDAALAEVEAVFHRRGVEPAIEYLAERHPALAGAAHARGWRTAMDAAVMVLEARARPAGHAHALDDATAVRFPSATDAATLDAYLRGQSRAYGGTGDDEALAWLPLLRAGLAAGTIAVAALTVEERVVAGASVQIGAGMGELAGVWTLPEARRRGHASTVCSALLRRVCTPQVASCWLSAAPDAVGLYHRLGFRRVGTQLNLAGPPPGSPPTPS